MDWFYSILKWVSQVLIVTGGVLSLLREPSIKDAAGKKSLTASGRITIVALVIGFVLFAVSDFKERKENTQKIAMQETTIAELRQVIQQLNKLSLDRDLREIEISFKPSPEQATRIAEAYSKIKSTSPPIPYSAATMRAERIGDHWKIDFDPVSRLEGVVRFAPVSSDQATGKAFEEVLRQASLALWIKWGTAGETELEPRQDRFPSAIIVSENAITFVLRPPLIQLNLNHLSADPNVIVRGGGDIKSLTFLSRDPAVILDQTVDLTWKEDSGSDKAADYMKRTKPFLSGPHRLQVSFKTVS